MGHWQYSVSSLCTAFLMIMLSCSLLGIAGAVVFVIGCFNSNIKCFA